MDNIVDSLKKTKYKFSNFMLQFKHDNAGEDEGENESDDESEDESEDESQGESQGESEGESGKEDSATEEYDNDNNDISDHGHDKQDLELVNLSVLILSRTTLYFALVYDVLLTGKKHKRLVRRQNN